MLFGGSTHTLPHLSLAPTARSFTRHCHRLAHARFLVGGKLAILILTVYGVLYTIVCVFDVSCALCARRCALCDVRCELCVVRCVLWLSCALCVVRCAVCVGVCELLRVALYITHHTPHTAQHNRTTHNTYTTQHKTRSTRHMHAQQTMHKQNKAHDSQLTNNTQRRGVCVCVCVWWKWWWWWWWWWR